MIASTRPAQYIQIAVLWIRPQQLTGTGTAPRRSAREQTTEAGRLRPRKRRPAENASRSSNLATTLKTTGNAIIRGRTYGQYNTLADVEAKLTFIGRCGTCRYPDRHQAIKQSLRGAHARMDAA